MANIILIGYRGTGKSVVAKELGKKLHRNIISTDTIFIEKYGDISKFVNNNGWEEFRKLEEEIINKIKCRDTIIDCGGGVIESKTNINKLKQLGDVFWLKASVDVIVSRIQDCQNRPALTSNNDFITEIKTVLKKRNPLYSIASDIEIITDNKSIKEIVKEISNFINKTKICIPIVETNVHSAKEEILKVNEVADIIELRLDYIEDIDVLKFKQILESVKIPVIVTCRIKEQGGTVDIDDSVRKQIFNCALENKCEYIDIEYGTKWAKEFIGKSEDTKVILSFHNFSETPNLLELNKIYDMINAQNSDIVKFITTANSINDNFEIFRLLENKNNLISFCMNQKGEISRILAPKYGSLITYSSLNTGKVSAPGQVNIEEMLELYNIQNINTKTNIFGIIGEFAENSKSKYMHNPAFDENQLNACFIPFKISSVDDLDKFMNNFKSHNFKGAAVTIPYKIDIIKHLNIIDNTAKRIGAVNTIISTEGVFYGYNTDYIGAITAIQTVADLFLKKVLVLGAGGAARAIIYGLILEKSEITIANRTFKTAQKLADEFHVNAIKMDNINEKLSQFDIIINTTSVGMYPNIDKSIINTFPPNKIVMDIVYKPLMTKFLKNAKKANCTIITGEKMLIYQAIAQQKIWTGKEPDYEIMEQAIVNPTHFQ